MIKKVSLALLVLASGINLFGQPPRGGGWDPANMPKESKITGNVIDQASEKPIEYVTIGIFRQKDSTLVTGGITDVHGHFLIDNLPFGKLQTWELLSLNHP